MSNDGRGAPGQARDKLMLEEHVRDMLARAYAGRLATVGPDGWPYIVPLLYVWRDGEVWVHNTSARGHLRTNVEHEPRVCFEVDEPGEVFAYGRFECDTSVAYRSVVAFGRIRIVEDRRQKEAFFDALMAKYGDPALGAAPRASSPGSTRSPCTRWPSKRTDGEGTPLPADARSLAGGGQHQDAGTGGRSSVRR